MFDLGDTYRCFKILRFNILRFNILRFNILRFNILRFNIIYKILYNVKWQIQ
jgi:hypothetical protein